MVKDMTVDPLVSATVRVRPPAAEPSGKPRQAALLDAAKILSDSGFRVLRVGRFGVSIEGDSGKFSRVLGVDVEPNRAVVAAVRPSDAKLKSLVDILEATPKPQTY
jgi:hypothetical protein